MIRQLHLELIRWERAFWRTQAYLASHMNDQLLVAEAECAAWNCERRLDVLSVQP